MAVVVKRCKRSLLVCCDFWFFAVIAVAVYIGGEALSLLLAALLHEAGHGFALLVTNNGITQLKLRGFSIKIIPLYRRIPTVGRELFILLAGPLAGILGAAFLKPFNPQFSKISLLLSVFNLLPVRGLDGGSMLKLLWEATFNGKVRWGPNAVGSAVVVWTLALGIRSIFEGAPNIPLIGVAAFLMLKQFVLLEDA